MHQREMTHSQIDAALQLSQGFFALEGEDPKRLIIEPLIHLSEKLSDLPGYGGLLGVGHPFYALNPESGEVAAVPSIDTYHQQQRQRVAESAVKYGDYWPCADCQVVNKLPNLTDQCNPADW